MVGGGGRWWEESGGGGGGGGGVKVGEGICCWLFFLSHYVLEKKKSICM